MIASLPSNPYFGAGKHSSGNANIPGWDVRISRKRGVGREIEAARRESAEIGLPIPAKVGNEHLSPIVRRGPFIVKVVAGEGVCSVGEAYIPVGKPLIPAAETEDVRFSVAVHIPDVHLGPTGSSRPVRPSCTGR